MPAWHGFFSVTRGERGPVMPGIRCVLRRSLLVIATGLLVLSAAMLTATARPAAAAVTCSAGYYAADSSCLAATPGSYAPGDNNEYPCPAGTYQPYSGEASCFTTGPGYYS